MTKVIIHKSGGQQFLWNRNQYLGWWGWLAILKKGFGRLWATFESGFFLIFTGFLSPRYPHLGFYIHLCPSVRLSVCPTPNLIFIPAYIIDFEIKHISWLCTAGILIKIPEEFPGILRSAAAAFSTRILIKILEEFVSHLSDVFDSKGSH